MSQSIHLPLVSDRSKRADPSDTRFSAPSAPVSPALLSELGALGVNWSSSIDPGVSRTGGAGPSDHKAMQLGGQTLMVPIFTKSASRSPFTIEAAGESALLLRHGEPVARIRFPKTPRFYGLATASGIPYFKIATLHSDNVLATTVLQNCVRFANRSTSCQFCAIGQSLSAQRTIPRKTPEQLAEVAEAAVRLDGVEHMVLTTGTPPGPDRGAAILSESAAAIRAKVALPLQAQCEPPDDPVWFERLKASGIDVLGMHLEAVTESVRRRIMPGKAEVSITRYLEAFDQAVRIFGRGQVTTYILAGLGDSHDAIVGMVRELGRRGVYSFVVPFVPIHGTPLEDHPVPDPAFMNALLDDVARELEQANLSSRRIKAGCGRCGACSTLKSRETPPHQVTHA